jgi:hypothetical protein
MGSIMRNLGRRIETLERLQQAKGYRSLRIAGKAVGWLWPDDAEHLLQAYGAERIGRPLTERETKAKQSYAEAVERECRWAGLHPTAFQHTSIDHAAIRQAAISVVAFRVSSEQLELCKKGLLAVQQGRTPSMAETAAAEAYCLEMERISKLAGFSGVKELEAVMHEVYLSESADWEESRLLIRRKR